MMRITQDAKMLYNRKKVYCPVLLINSITVHNQTMTARIRTYFYKRKQACCEYKLFESLGRVLVIQTETLNQC